MDLIKTLAVFLVFLTISSTTDAQIGEIKAATNATKTTSKFLEESEGNAQRKGRENPPENKQGTEAMLLPCLDPKAQLKGQISTPKPKSMPIPLNFVINTKPRTIPTKIPLVLKTANVQPAPAHYVRLKADPDRKKSSQPKLPVNLNLNKETPKIKVTAQDKVTPKSILNLALNAKRQKQTPRKYKLRSVNFYEDDTNIDSLPPALKQPVTRKSKKPDSKNDSSKDIHLLTIFNEPKQKTRDYETDSDHSNDVVHIRNGTHAIRITKLQNTGHKEPNTVSTKLQEQIFRGNPEHVTLDGLVQPLLPQKEEVTVAVLVNKDGIDTAAEQSVNKIETLMGEPSVITPTAEDVTPDIITITNHNYEEVEERGGTYPENNMDEDSNQPWATPSWKTAATNPYNNYLQNYQTFYDQYLKYIAENNPTIYKKGNCYPRVNLPEQDSDTDPDFTQTYTPTSEGQMVQDVFYGQKPENNVIQIRPENNLGRIWRTWKDTEIRITKPNALNNNMKPVDIGRNLNDMKYGEVIGKAPALYNNPAIGLNGYYDNLNNPLTYPFPYPTYRYVL